MILSRGYTVILYSHIELIIHDDVDGLHLHVINDKCLKRSGIVRMLRLESNDYDTSKLKIYLDSSSQL